MKKKEKIILSFDLDFTLIDNTEGIINSFNYAFNKHELPRMNTDDLEKTIGIPLFEVFSKVSTIEPSVLIDTFRDFYRKKGIYQVRLLPGVKEKLQELRDIFVLGVITSKKEEMAVKLLRFLRIDNYFNYILGEKEGRMTKTDPRLKKYLSNSYPTHKFIIIGDHPNDRKLAEMLKCPFIGVLTGFHSAEELKENSKIKMKILKNITEITPDKIYSLI